jgi:enoyl-CoA hydratase/carnithine racemase
MDGRVSAVGYETIIYEVDAADRVATITLNRPEVLNAFNRTMCHEVRDAWHRVQEDSGVNAVVLQAS